MSRFDIANASGPASPRWRDGKAGGQRHRPGLNGSRENYIRLRPGSVDTSCPGSVSPTLQDRLRGVTWTGNLLVGGFVLGLGTWSTFASLESAAVATGTIESELSRKTIQHFEGGIIKQIIVADGDVVRAGQTLILLDDTKARSEVQSLRGQLWDAVAREARLLAEQHGYERVSFPTDLQEEQKSNSRRCGRCGRAAKHLRDAPAGRPVANSCHQGQTAAGGEGNSNTKLSQ